MRRRLSSWLVSSVILFICLQIFISSVLFDKDDTIYTQGEHIQDLSFNCYVDKAKRNNDGIRQSKSTHRENPGKHAKQQLRTIPKQKVPGCDKMPEWQLRRITHPWEKKRNSMDLKYFLTEALQVRIYENDKAKWTLRELKQWLHYMFWAGVEHVYLCDHYLYNNESLMGPLGDYLELGLITYIRLQRHQKAMDDQVNCYQIVAKLSKERTVWQFQIDMDEYPFVLADQKEGFMVRYLNQFQDNITEISLHNYLMLGQGDRNRTMVIDRINRCTRGRLNDLDKPITKPNRIEAGLHHNRILQGKAVDANDTVIRMLHYWGSRLQRWGPDTPRILNMTVEFNDVRNKMAPVLRNSLLCFGETDAFSNVSGP